MLLLLFLIRLILVLFTPCLIVGFWKKRPVIAFIIATLVMFITVVAPSLIKTFQAMLIYGEGDPELLAGGISEAIVGALLLMIVCIPLLFLFQWFILRRHRRKNPKVDADKTFS